MRNQVFAASLTEKPGFFPRSRCIFSIIWGWQMRNQVFVATLTKKPGFFLPEFLKRYLKLYQSLDILCNI